MTPTPARRSAGGRLVLAVALAATAAVGLSACVGTASPAATTAAAVTKGGNLKISIDSDPVCLDPVQSSLIASGVIGRQLVDSLLEQDPDTGAVKPWLATQWKANADGTKYDFTLKSGVTFSDGTPLDANAVKANFDQVAATPGKSAAGAAFLTGYAGTTVTDSTHLTVNFSAPNAPFLVGATSRALGIVAPATVATSWEDRCLGKNLIGSGPFVFDSYSPNQSVKIVKRKGYDWGPSLAKHTGDAYLDSVIYSVNPEPSVRSGALKSGQVDVATTIQSQDEKTLNGSGFHILSRVNPGIVTAVTPNLAASDILKDDAVREAIQLAIDRAQITNVVLTKTYGVATSILGDTTPGYADLTKELKSDPAAAKKLLDKAGWKTGSDGIREKNGKKLQISVLYFYQPNVYEYLQQLLRAVGIDLKLHQVTAAEFTAQYTTAGDDLRQSSYSRPDPDILRTVFGPKTQNALGLPADDAQTAQLNDLLQKQRETTDTTKRADYAKQIQELLVEKDWAFPLAQLVQVTGSSEKVSGIRFDSFSIIELYDAGFVS